MRSSRSGRPIVVIGAGIVGLATGWELIRRGHQVIVLDKETEPARHQTGRNSGVIHSGLYYRPGSLKASLGVAGADSMFAFVRAERIAVDRCGKLVVATRQHQVPALLRLLDRGRANGVPLRLVSPDEAHQWEPAVRCVAALRVESTGIVDYPGVSRRLVELIAEAGGEFRFGARVVGIDAGYQGLRVTADQFGETDVIDAGRLVNCAGLQADRIARLAGLEPPVRILPFRGEYFELAEDQWPKITNLIYPVPDPELPFLGVHLTRMIGGGVHAGPNAVLALAREGYRWGDVSLSDLAEVARWPGSWRLAGRFWRTGVSELLRSVSQQRFLAALRELVPDLADDCLVPAPAGVRAQAVDRTGKLVDDFVLERGIRQVHVLNAPSPAATAAFEIGRRIADQLLGDAD